MAPTQVAMEASVDFQPTRSAVYQAPPPRGHPCAQSAICREKGEVQGPHLPTEGH